MINIYEINQVLDQQDEDDNKIPANKGLVNDRGEFGLDPEGNGEPLKAFNEEEVVIRFYLWRDHCSQNKFSSLKKLKTEIRKISLEAPIT